MVIKVKELIARAGAKNVTTLVHQENKTIPFQSKGFYCVKINGYNNIQHSQLKDPQGFYKLVCHSLKME